MMTLWARLKQALAWLILNGEKMNSLTSDFAVGDKVKIPFPGHSCSRFDTAEILALEAPGHPELFVLRFPQSGLVANCQPERLEKI